jgi:hypothetical protein
MNLQGDGGDGHNFFSIQITLYVEATFGYMVVSKGVKKVVIPSSPPPKDEHLKVDSSNRCTRLAHVHGKKLEEGGKVSTSIKKLVV